MDDVDLYVHHKDPVRNGGSHELRNLVTLCGDCHSKVDVHASTPATVDYDDVLREIERQIDTEYNPVVTAPELAEELPIAKRTVNDKLNQLLAAGLVANKDVSTGKAWWPLTRDRAE